MLDLVRHLVRQRRRLGPLPRRVDEREGAVVPDCLDDLQRLPEVVLRLAGEADDDVGAERETGNRVAQLGDEPQIALAVVGAPHGLQDPARAGLERQVDVLAHGVAFDHGGDDGVAEVLRVRAREADPVDPVDRVAGAQELAELGLELGTQVASPGVHVLPEQRHLPHTVGREPGDLGDDLARPTALLPAANGRDDAVRALRVAAHRDLHPGTERALAVHRAGRRRSARESEAAARSLAPGPEPLAEVRDRAGAERDVDLRVELEDPFALRLGVAAADGDDELRVLALPRSRVAEIGGELGVRLLADRAGVEDEDVGVSLRGRLAEPDRFEHALDPLGVVSVHLAAERGDVVPLHRPLSLAPPRSDDASLREVFDCFAEQAIEGRLDPPASGSARLPA